MAWLAVVVVVVVVLAAAAPALADPDDRQARVVVALADHDDRQSLQRLQLPPILQCLSQLNVRTYNR